MARRRFSLLRFCIVDSSPEMKNERFLMGRSGDELESGGSDLNVVGLRLPAELAVCPTRERVA